MFFYVKNLSRNDFGVLYVEKLLLVFFYGQLYDKMETLYMEISRVLDTIQQKSDCCGHQSVGASELHSYIFELKDLLKKERDDYNVSCAFYYICIVKARHMRICYILLRKIDSMTPSIRSYVIACDDSSGSVCDT